MRRRRDRRTNTLTARTRPIAPPDPSPPPDAALQPSSELEGRDAELTEAGSPFDASVAPASPSVPAPKRHAMYGAGSPPSASGHPPETQWPTNEPDLHTSPSVLPSQGAS